MRLLFIGCSWTDYRNHGIDCSSVPKEFLNFFKGRIDVISHGGSSIDMHYDLLQTVNLDNYDFVVFQVTGAYRGYFRKNQWQVFTEDDFDQQHEGGVYDLRNYLENNYEWFNGGWFDRLSKENFKKAKAKILSLDNNEKEWLEFIEKIEKYLKEKNKKYIIYHHTLEHLENAKIINKAKRYLCVEDWLGKDFQGFCIDQGKHFNKKGNKIIAMKLYSLYKDITS